jgi:hypothetical protein
MRREAFVLNELSWWRAMPIGVFPFFKTVSNKTVVQPVRIPKAR